jgi:NAD(P)H-nitrite reductase large subunit
VTGDRLVGAILLGDTTPGPQLAELLRTGAPVPADLVEAAAAANPWPACENDDALVCSCNAVTRGRIMDAAREGALSDVEAVSRATGAATGCGTCRHNVAALLRDLAAER